MKSTPLLFKADMVRAILNGTKTQTRRLWKMPKWAEWDVQAGGETKGLIQTKDGKGWGYDLDEVESPYGRAGDQLYVKESAWMWCEKKPNGKTKTGRDKFHYVPVESSPIYYAAEHRTKPHGDVYTKKTGNEFGWRLKISRFLPKWASRIQLEITGVRVERLNDCSEADAGAEGIEGSGLYINGITEGIHWRDYLMDTDDICEWFTNPINSYKSLWEKINGKGSWDANPWVWVIEFKVIKP